VAPNFVRSLSQVSSSSGPFDKPDARRLVSAVSSKVNKYADDDDDDYEVVFGELNGSCVRLLSRYMGCCD
jgi:hypothetical protein